MLRKCFIINLTKLDYCKNHVQSFQWVILLLTVTILVIWFDWKKKRFRNRSDPLSQWTQSCVALDLHLLHLRFASHQKNSAQDDDNEESEAPGWSRRAPRGWTWKIRKKITLASLSRIWIQGEGVSVPRRTQLMTRPMVTYHCFGYFQSVIICSFLPWELIKSWFYLLL